MHNMINISFNQNFVRKCTLIDVKDSNQMTAKGTQINVDNESIIVEFNHFSQKTLNAFTQQ